MKSGLLTGVFVRGHNLTRISMAVLASIGFTFGLVLHEYPKTPPETSVTLEVRSSGWIMWYKIPVKIGEDNPYVVDLGASTLDKIFMGPEAQFPKQDPEEYEQVPVESSIGSVPAGSLPTTIDLTGPEERYEATPSANNGGWSVDGSFADDSITSLGVGVGFVSDVETSFTTLTIACGVSIDLNTGKVAIPDGVSLDQASLAFWRALEGQYLQLRREIRREEIEKQAADVVWAIETLLRMQDPLSGVVVTADIRSPQEDHRRKIAWLDQRDADLKRASEILERWKKIQADL